MDEEWEFSDEEVDAWLAEWQEVDRAAADYLAERLPDVAEELSGEDARWVDQLIETFCPSDEPAGEEFASVMALQHVDWLGIALGAVQRGPGTTLEAEQVLADVAALEDVDGEIEDPEGTVSVLSTALLVLTRPWQDLGVLDPDERLTERGVWGLPRALHRNWSR